MKHGLTSQTIAEIHRVFSAYPDVEKAILYGSRAKGSYRSGSDIDLALVGRDLDRGVLSSISTELEESSLPYRVDLSVLSEIRHPALLDHIERVGTPLYQRQGARAK